MPQLGDRVEPIFMSRACGRQRVLVAVCHEHLAHDPYLGRGHVAVEPARLIPVRLPSLSVCIHELMDVRGWSDAGKMIAMHSGIADALRVMRRIPQGRIRLL